ncbi:MAG: GHKL domain-containing protein [Clostridia bacterium]|nr:GHKL domain-containing protein [Clostridia bacterium]
MEKTVIWTSVLIYLFESVLFWYYCQTAFQSKYKKGINYLLILAVMAVGCVVNIVFFSLGWSVTIFNSVYNIVALSALIYFLYGQKLLNSVIHASIYFALIVASEYIIIPILGSVFGGQLETLYQNPAFYFYVGVFARMVHLILVVLVLKIYLSFFSKGEEGASNKEKTKGLLLILFVPFSGLAMFSFAEKLYMRLSLSTSETVFLTICGVLMIFTTFVAFYLHSNTVKQAQKISRYAIEQKQREFDAQYYALVEKSNEELQILSHDFKNHLIQLKSIDSVEQVRDYVDKLYPTIRDFDAATVSDNATLNVIISKYNTLCSVKGIDFQYHIESALENLEASDLSAILNNLLDNALEAAEQSVGKCIELNIFKKNENLESILLTNSADSAPVEESGELLSSKNTADKNAQGATFHGVGLKSVKKTIAKYSGFYEWQYDEEKKEFTTTISFYH